MIDGPFAERFPNPYNADGEIEVRQLFEVEDFDISKETADRFRAIGEWE